MAEDRVGAIDIGTNTVLLLVAGGTRAAPVAIAERATITRLGRGVDRTRRLQPDAMARTIECLEGYAELLSALGVIRTLAVCTSAARDSENGREFLERAARVLGTAPRIIDGDEEARLVFDGALTGLRIDGAVTVFDIGGGSTEIIRGTSGDGGVTLERAVSVNVGSVRLTERHVRHDPPLSAEIEAMRRDIAATIPASFLDRSTELVGVAGTMTSLAAIDQELGTYDPARVHGASLRRDRIRTLFDRLSTTPLHERRRIAGLDPERADVIVAGTLIALELVDRAGANEVVVSDRGVRWGLVRGLLPPD